MRALAFLLVLIVIGFPASAQTSWNGSVLELNCGGERSLEPAWRERRCVEFIAADRILLGDNIVCTAEARTAKLCPSGVVDGQFFPDLLRQPCIAQDVAGARARCLYGRGDDVATVGDLPTCAEADWGVIVKVKADGLDRLCDGISWAVTTKNARTWLPVVYESAQRETVATLPACNAAREQEARIVTDGVSNSDCSTGLGTTAHRCRCLSLTWVGETGEYLLWPPSSPSLSVRNVANLPPCNASTNDVRAWVSTDLQRPWDGALWRCQNPTWAVNVGNYRLSASPDSLGTISRDKCRSANCWLPPGTDTAVSDANSNLGYLGRVSQDAIKREIDRLLNQFLDDGRADLQNQANDPPDTSQ